MISQEVNSKSNYHDLLLMELNYRSSLLPIKSTKGNKCLCIDLQGSSMDFVLFMEGFLEENKSHLKLHVTGNIYYVEVVSSSGIRKVLGAYKGKKLPA